MKPILVAILCAAAARAQNAGAKSWNRDAAAAYLDARMAWWAAWPSAPRAIDTFCVSCHTSLPTRSPVRRFAALLRETSRLAQ